MTKYEDGQAKATEELDYEVIADGWVAGERRTAGDRVRMTATRAKYEPVRRVEGTAAKTTKRAAKAAAEGGEA